MKYYFRVFEKIAKLQVETRKCPDNLLIHLYQFHNLFLAGVVHFDM